MDGMTFIATLVSALAWPAVVVIALLLLRKPMAELVPCLG
jgi:hypothetical protein